MERHGLTTINLIFAQTSQQFHSRNAFAIGGVSEGPATGAAAALVGYLRDMNWPRGGQVDIKQEHDMSIPSKLWMTIPPEPGTPVSVAGTSRDIA